MAKPTKLVFNLKQWIKSLLGVAIWFVLTRVLAFMLTIYVVKPVFLLTGNLSKFITFFAYKDLVAFIKYVDIVWGILFTVVFVLNFWIKFVFLQPAVSIFLRLNLEVLQVPFRELITKFDKLYIFFVTWWIYSLGLLGIIIYEVIQYHLPLYVLVVPAIFVFIAFWLLALVVKRKINTILLYNTYYEKT